MGADVPLDDAVPVGGRPTVADGVAARLSADALCLAAPPGSAARDHGRARGRSDFPAAVGWRSEPEPSRPQRGAGRAVRSCREWPFDVRPAAPTHHRRGGGTGRDRRSTLHRTARRGFGRREQRLPRPEPGRALRSALLVAQRAGRDAGHSLVAGPRRSFGRRLRRTGGGRSSRQAALRLGGGVLAACRAGRAGAGSRSS